MERKICPKCKKEVTSNVKFCPKCGENLEKVETMTTVDPKEEYITTMVPNQNQSNKKVKIAIAIVASIIVVVIAVILLWIFVFSDNKEKKNDGKVDHNVVEKEDDPSDEEKDDDEEKEDDDDKEKLSYYGNTYAFSDGVAWLKDRNYTYLVNEKGKVISKFNNTSENSGYYDLKESSMKDGYVLLGDIVYNKKGEEVELADDYEEMAYYEDGLLVVTTKEEDYKGTTIKRGIYDLEHEKYIFPLNENVYRISYLGEGMYLLYFNQEYNYVVYDSKTNNSFDIGDRFDVLRGQYRDGYIIYQDINAYEVYALDKKGNKTLIDDNSRHAEIGQYSDGLVFINDAFYDVKGNKVIDLKDEGVSNHPEFVNGYALVFFDTGYFTILSKETKKYMFEPKACTTMGNTYNGSFSLGVYNEQKVISKDGHLLVRLYDKDKETKRWAIMDVKGNIVHEFSEAISLNTVISDNGYVGVSDKVKQESYYVSVKGEKLFIYE